MVAHLREAFDVAGGDRPYPNRGSFGVRVYLEIQPRGDQPHVQHQRGHMHRKQVEP